MNDQKISELWHHLHWLSVLAQQGSYTAAAARLGVSKAAMSQRIAELERWAAGIKPGLTFLLDVGIDEGLGAVLAVDEGLFRLEGIVVFVLGDHPLGAAMVGGVPFFKLGGMALKDLILAPTRIYVKPVLALAKKIPLKGIAHITGGEIGRAHV